MPCSTSPICYVLHGLNWMLIVNGAACSCVLVLGGMLKDGKNMLMENPDSDMERSSQADNLGNNI